VPYDEATRAPTLARFARIVALPAKERPTALEAEARRLLDSSDDTAAPAIAADMFAALEQLPD